MALKKGWLLGCGIFAGLLLFVGVAVVLFVVYVSKDPKGIAVLVDSPVEVKQNAEFDLVVNVTSEREKEICKVSTIDLSEEYLQGFVILSTEPKPKSSQHVPFDNSRSFEFNASIPSKQTRTFTFKLRAIKTGLYCGDIDVCEGMRFTTTMAQTEVK